MSLPNHDAGIGRFISADTVVQSPGNPQTLNRYSYCLNNPLKYIDPSGHGAIIGEDEHGNVIQISPKGNVSPNAYPPAPNPPSQEPESTEPEMPVEDDDTNIKTMGVGEATIGAGEVVLVTITIAVNPVVVIVGGMIFGLLFLSDTPPKQNISFDRKYPGNDPSKSPGEDWEWRGNGPPGSKEGNYYNPKTGEWLHPDLDHPGSEGPHWDYNRPGGGKGWRIYPDGTIVPKK